MADLRNMTRADAIETLRWEAPTGYEIGQDTEGSYTLKAKHLKRTKRRQGRRNARRLLDTWEPE